LVLAGAVSRHFLNLGYTYIRPAVKHNGELS
jgi:hypothetical protein